MATAIQRLLDLLSDLQWHTPKQMEHVAGNRYAARAYDLRAKGYQIATRPSSTGEGVDARLQSLKRSEPLKRRVKAFLDEQDAIALLEGRVTNNARRAVKEALDIFRRNSKPKRRRPAQTAQLPL
jgi:hypothetical protein